MHLVLSFGDLSRFNGYRTRVLGMLQNLEYDYRPFLLVFDRDPQKLADSLRHTVPEYQVIPRRQFWRFFWEIWKISHWEPLRTVHAHNLYSAALALSVRWKYRYKVILDLHGRIPEEYVTLGKGGLFSKWVLERLESWCVRKADHVVAVSNPLKQYLITRYGISEKKITVIPCCA